MATPMDLRRLRYFVAVAEELHFGRAAARLHMSQPPLSKQIHLLETELNVQLFHRTSRGVELTEAGKALLVGARRVFAEAERASNAVRSVGSAEVGDLTIGLVSSASYEILPLALGFFRRRHPRVRVSVELLDSNEQADAIRSGRIDVGFLRLPVPNSDDLRFWELGSEHVIATLPSGHRLASAASIDLQSLAGECFITYPRIYDRLIVACHEAGFTPTSVLQASPVSVIVGLVAAGFGVAPLPASASYFALPGVVHVPLDPPPFDLDIDVAWHALAPSETARAFVSTLEESLADSSALSVLRTSDTKFVSPPANLVLDNLARQP